MKIPEGWPEKIEALVFITLILGMLVAMLVVSTNQKAKDQAQAASNR